MRFERVFVDSNGKRYRAVVDIAENGPAFERLIQSLANQARDSARQRATRCGGAIRVVVHPLKEEDLRR